MSPRACARPFATNEHVEFAFAFGSTASSGGSIRKLHDITEIGVIMTDYRLKEIGTEKPVACERPARPHHRRVGAMFGYDDEAVWAEGARRAPGPDRARRDASQGQEDRPGGPERPHGRDLPRARHYKNCGIPYPFDYHVIDLATLFYSWSLVAGEKVSALSLRQAATTAGLVDGAVPHRALEDARLTLEAYRHFIGRLALSDPSETPPTTSAAANASDDAKAPDA